MKTELEKLRQEFNIRIDNIINNPEDLKNEKPKFEVGKYYRVSYTGEHCYGLPYDKEPFYILRFNRFEQTNDGKRMIFDHCTWKDKEIMFACEEMEWFEREATIKEVEEHLIAEAKKRGFKFGCTANNSSVHEEKFKNFKFESVRDFYYDFTEDTLYWGSSDDGKWALYKNGLWAEIIKEDKLFLDKEQKYEIKFNPCSMVKEVTIDGHKFPKDFFQSALLVLIHSKASVLLGCDAKTKGTHSWVLTKELNDKILEKLK